MSRIALAALAAALLLAPTSVTASPPPAVTLALDFLAAQQGLDGCIGNPQDSAWSAIAFARGGVDPEDVMLPGGASLEDCVIADTSPGMDAAGLTRQVLAIVATGADPRTAAGFDAVQRMRDHFDGDQYGNPTLLNDDIFALQALAAAGVPGSDAMVQELRAFIMANQQPSGAWSYGTIDIQDPNVLFAVAFADTDTTAAALVALLHSGSVPEDLPVLRATLWLKANQGVDGGHNWSPAGLVFDAIADPSRIGQSNADSTSWGIMGLRVAGQDPEGPLWTMPVDENPVDFLRSLQLPSGQFEFRPGSGGFAPLSTTAFAAIALSGHDFVA